MHTFDLNLDWVGEEEEEVRNLSAEALGSSDEELNGFIDYFLRGPDSADVSQSNQIRLPEVSSIPEGMDLDFVELGLGFRLDSDTNNEAPLFDLNESGESSSSSMSESELVCEEDFRVFVNESNTNNPVPQMLVQDVANEIQFDYNDAMMVDTPDNEVITNYNDGEEGIGMNINAAYENDGDDEDRFFDVDMLFNNLLVRGSNVHNEIVEGSDEYVQYDEDGMLFSWVWNNSSHEIVEGQLEQLWREYWPEWPALEESEWDTWDDDTNIIWSMKTVACDVDNLPSVTLTQEELNKTNSICAICMENFCIEEKLKRLPCFHYYHVDCISPWLRTRNTCPTCRYELPIK